MEAYRIERFGSVDGIGLRSSKDPQPGLTACRESGVGRSGGLLMRLLPSRSIPFHTTK